MSLLNLNDGNKLQRLRHHPLIPHLLGPEFHQHMYHQLPRKLKHHSPHNQEGAQVAGNFEEPE